MRRERHRPFFLSPYSVNLPPTQTPKLRTPTLLSGLACLSAMRACFPTWRAASVHNGARLLINVTNDAWFGETSAPYQHLAMEAMRAVENRVPLVRAANTGISAIVDIDGRIRARTALLETTLLADRLAWPQVTAFYTRHGDWFVTLCGVGTLVMLGFSGIAVWFVKRNGGGGYARRNQRKIT